MIWHKVKENMRDSENFIVALSFFTITQNQKWQKTGRKAILNSINDITIQQELYV